MVLLFNLRPIATINSLIVWILSLIPLYSKISIFQKDWAEIPIFFQYALVILLKKRYNSSNINMKNAYSYMYMHTQTWEKIKQSSFSFQIKEHLFFLSQ